MKALEELLRNAAKSKKRIVLSEGEDPRIIEAAQSAASKGVADIILVGSHAKITAQMPDIPRGIEIEDPATSVLTLPLSGLLHELRSHKGMTEAQAREATMDPHVFAALMVKSERADGTVGGAVATTAEIVRTALQVIGKAPDAQLVSSFFLMLFCQDHHDHKGAHIFSDCGLVIDPNAEEMAQIALMSSASFSALTGETPRVAMLSFSTKGSAKHGAVSKVTEATARVKALAPRLIVDGELQFDAAFVPDVAASKAKESPLEGLANVFIFPNLDSGNIAYKIAQRLGGANAIGPILQGLSRPANDLSRGCTAEDVLHMIAITAAQAEAIGQNNAQN